MLTWTMFFLVVAIIAALLGFGGLDGVTADIARVLFFVFLVISLTTLVSGLIRRRP
jgi:uncharacterized membrane protein YtjA (UPF0391 family)